MDIYFAGSIRGSQRPDQAAINESILSAIRGLGHTIISEHGLVTDKLHMETWSDRQIYSQDREWVMNSQALIAECSGASHGVGYEICLAEVHDIPVLVLHHADTKPSAMITGNSNIRVHSYADTAAIRAIVRDFLFNVESDYGE